MDLKHYRAYIVDRLSKVLTKQNKTKTKTRKEALIQLKVLPEREAFAPGGTWIVIPHDY